MLKCSSIYRVPRAKSEVAKKKHQQQQTYVKPVCDTINELFKYNVQLGRCNSHKLLSSSQRLK